MLQRKWGCDAERIEAGEKIVWKNKAELPIQIDGEDWWGCPRRPIKDFPAEISQILSTMQNLKRGFLPYSGGVRQQPYKLMILANHAESCYDRILADQRERDSKKRSRKPSVRKG